MTKIALISALPKSGTWYSKIFFWYYEQLLQNPQAYLQGRFRPDIEPALYQLRNFCESEHHNTLGIDKLYITHSNCPGFNENLKDPLYQQWQALQFPVIGYNGGEWHIRDLGRWDLLNPASNSGVRIVYLYRNPLDHFVSYYQHVQNHVHKSHRSKILPDGTLAPFDNLHDFVFGWNGLSGFIKHYYSFRQMKARFPNQIMFMPYEQLTADPHQSFYNILSFLGSAPDNSIRKQLFELALAMSSKPSLMRLESRLDVSLGGDQVAGGRHIRDGQVGKWKSHFSDIEIKATESVLNLFNITLNDFTLDNGKGETMSLSWLADIEAVNKLRHQNKFLQQQLTLAGAGIAAELTNILSSRSWHMTAPLRALSRITRKIKAAVMAKKERPGW